jgi:hypothetical protein
MNFLNLFWETPLPISLLRFYSHQEYEKLPHLHCCLACAFKSKSLIYFTLRSDTYWLPFAGSPQTVNRELASLGLLTPFVDLFKHFTPDPVYYSSLYKLQNTK